MTKQLQTEKIDGIVVNNQLVILRGKSGVSVDAAEAKKIITLVEAALPGDYSILVDRVNDYSVSPVGVYAYLNTLSRLKAMALVVYRPISISISEIEQSLSSKPIQVFNDIEQASRWLQSRNNAAEDGEQVS